MSAGASVTSTRRAAGMAGTAASGDLISTGVSSRPKMRSDDAIADCMTLNFSDRSLIGRKNCCAYPMNATSEPSVTVSCSARPPPYQRIRPVATAPSSSIAG